MAQQVGQAGLERLEVLVRELRLGHAAVVLEGAHGGDEHHRGRHDARGAALDVEELLGAQVRAEAGLGDHVVGQAHRGGGGHHGVAAVRDVGERAAVHEGGVVLERLHEVGLDGVLQQGGHGTLGVDVGDGDGLAVVGVGDHHAGEALLEVREVGGEAEHGHDLGGHRDVEAVLARHAVGHAAEAVAPDDPVLARALAHLAPEVSDYVKTLNRAQKAEKSGDYAAALNYFLAAQNIFPASQACRLGIERVAGKYMQ